MNLDQIPKYVINLKSRPDRLESITKEFKYVGWEFELFEAINTNSYMGCTLSHLKILEIAHNKGYEKVAVFEDDCTFMPYSKTLISGINSIIDNVEYYILNLSPTLNRPVNVHKDYQILLDITNLPDKPNPNLTEIFATNAIVYDVSLINEINKISEYKFHSGDYVLPIDEFLVKNIYPKYQSYAPILPLSPQINSYSDVSLGMYNNFHTQTYNWNLYSPVKIPDKFLDYSRNKEIKDRYEHLDYV